MAMLAYQRVSGNSSRNQSSVETTEDWFIANLSEKYLATKTRFVAGQYLYIYTYIIPIITNKKRS